MQKLNRGMSLKLILQNIINAIIFISLSISLFNVDVNELSMPDLDQIFLKKWPFSIMWPSGRLIPRELHSAAVCSRSDQAQGDVIKVLRGLVQINLSGAQDEEVSSPTTSAGRREPVDSVAQGRGGWWVVLVRAVGSRPVRVSSQDFLFDDLVSTLAIQTFSSYLFFFGPRRSFFRCVSS